MLSSTFKTIRFSNNWLVVLSLLFILTVNYYFISFLMPVFQKDANSHMRPGDLLSLTFYLISVTFLVLSFYAFFKHKKIRNFLIYILLFGLLAYWGYKLQAMICEVCAQGG
jgi:hypothetical protein